MTDYGGQRPTPQTFQSVEGIVSMAATQFPRPADITQYAIGDLVANNTTAGSVVPLSFSGLEASRLYKVRNGSLMKSSTGLTSATFRLHLFTEAPVPSNGDNGAFLTSLKGVYIGAIDMAIMALAFVDGAIGYGLPLTGTELVFTAPATGIIRGLIEARATYTPVSAETFDASITCAPVN